MPTPLHPFPSLPSTGRLGGAGEADALMDAAKRGEPSKPNNAVEAAKNFESVMVTELLKTMRATIPEGEDGFAMKTTWGMFDESISNAAAGGLGLAPMIARDLGATEEEVRAMMRTNAAPVGPEASLRLHPKLGEPSAPPVPVGIQATARYEARLPSNGQRVRSGVASPGLPQPGLMPTRGVISSEYGWRTHPISGKRRFHEGVDIAAPEGTEIRAVQSGKVRFAGNKGGYGKVVELEHADGSITRYAHAARIHVQRGDRIEVGESIADVGQTGHATGPHLHFQVERGGKATDPIEYLTELRAAQKGP